MQIYSVLERNYANYSKLFENICHACNEQKIRQYVQKHTIYGFRSLTIAYKKEFTTAQIINICNIDCV